MDASLDGVMVDVVVVGGGLAGLSAAATAAGGGGRRVVLLDSQGNGGRAASDDVGRYRFNRGAHALYRTGPGRAVLRDLGVTVTGAPPPPKGYKARIGDRVGVMPVGVTSLARTDLLGARDKVALGRLLAAVGRWKPEREADLTITQWLDERGLDGVARQFVEMLVRLTSYAADLDLVSADVAVTQVQGALAGGVDYLHDGWASLVEGLAGVASRRHVRIATGARCRGVAPDGGGLRVELEGGGSLRARRVVLAVGTPPATAALLPGGHGPASWERLAPPARAACLDLGLRTPPPVQLLMGIDTPLYLSRHAPVSKGLAPEGAGTANLVRYLRADEDPSPAQVQAQFAEHCRLAGFDPDTAEESRYLHRMVVVGAQPTPASGGIQGRPAVGDTGVDGTYIAGDWVGPEGWLADASLVSGAAAARAALDSLDRERVVA